MATQQDQRPTEAGAGAAPPGPVIALDGVSKRFGSRQALDGLTLDVREGEVLGLLGPYGAGKTTILRMAATLLQPDAGTVTVAGVRADRDPRGARRKVGYLPDSAGVYRRLTAREYVEFYAGVHGVKRAQRRPLAGALLEVLGLSGHTHDEACTLGKGEQRRLGLARTLVHDPAVLLLDEPASGLDPRSRAEVQSLVAELVAMGKTLVIAGAALADLEAMCTSLALLDRGRVSRTGPLDEVAGEVAATLGRGEVPR